MERNVGLEAKVLAPGKLNALLGRAQKLSIPREEERGHDWSAFKVPRNVLCFLCEQEDHSLRSWNPLSTLSGKFHQYDRYCLIVALEGDGLVGIEDSLVALEEGEALIVQAHQKHYYLNIAKQFSWLYFMFDIDSSGSELDELAARPHTVSRKGRRILNQILESYQTVSSAGEAFELSLSLNDFLTDLKKAPEVERELGRLTFVEKVKIEVFAHLEEVLSLEELSQKLEMTVTQLKDEYRRATGDTLGNFVRSARLVHAANLLRTGEMEILAVAEHCGFRSRGSFADAFEAQYRVSPEEYQTAAQSGELRRR